MSSWVRCACAGCGKVLRMDDAVPAAGGYCCKSEADSGAADCPCAAEASPDND